MNLKPMKAPVLEDKDLKLLKFPLFASLKLDGIRALIKNYRPLSSALKPIRNKHVQLLMSLQHFEGMDGELLLKCNEGEQPLFNEVSSAIMSEAGTPDFVLHVFDRWNVDKPYILRYEQLRRQFHGFKGEFPWVTLLKQHLCENLEELMEFEAKAIEAGYEGIMLRHHLGKYKYGDSTLKEQYLLKRKPMQDAEAIVIGFEEELANTNEATIDNLGHTKRSTHKEGMVGKDTLGKFIVRTKRWGIFRMGKGRMTHQQAKEIWDNKIDYLDKIIVFKYQAIGEKDKPRLPIFKSFRNPDDLTPERLEEI